MPISQQEKDLIAAAVRQIAVDSVVVKDLRVCTQHHVHRQRSGENVAESRQHISANSRYCRAGPAPIFGENSGSHQPEQSARPPGTVGAAVAAAKDDIVDDLHARLFADDARYLMLPDAGRDGSARSSDIPPSAWPDCSSNSSLRMLNRTAGVLIMEEDIHSAETEADGQKILGRALRFQSTSAACPPVSF